MNKALREAGEPDIKVPVVNKMDYSQESPLIVKNEDLEDAQAVSEETNRRLSELKRRKSRLYEVVIGYWEEFIEHQNKVPAALGGPPFRALS